jgi:hypothetical protein
LDDKCVACPQVQAPHAVAACLFATQCGYSCEQLWGDCNHLASDGCETSLGDDAENCGACGVRCHGTCANGICAARFDGEETVGALIGEEHLDPRDPSSGTMYVRRLIWTRWDGGTLDIRTAVLDGTEPLTLASVPASAGVAPSLAAADGFLYWTTGSALQADGGGAVYRMSSTNPAALPTQLAANQDGPGNLFVLDGGVYWSDELGGQVVRVDADGGVPQIIASDQPRPGGITSDGERLYWVNQGIDGGGGAVMQLPLGGGTPQAISTDSRLVDGTVAPTAGAPTAIALVRTQPAGAAGRTGDVAVLVWADGPTRTVWGRLADSAPAAFTWQAEGPWEPAQLFALGESFLVFNRAADWSFDSGLFIPGEPPYGGPFPFFPVAAWPPETRLLSPGPIPGTWTDGKSVGSNSCIQGLCGP